MPRYVVEDILGDTGHHKVKSPEDAQLLIMKLFHEQYGHRAPSIEYAKSYYCLMKEVGPNSLMECACGEMVSDTDKHMSAADMLMENAKILIGTISTNN